MQARAGLLFGMAVVALTGPTAVAQEQDTTNTIDRIVAIVGTRAILASQVTERFYTELANREPPKDPKVVRQLQQGILRSMVNEELVVQEAQRDTMIKVTDQEVTESVDELYRNIRTRLSEEQFRQQLTATGFQTLEEWRSFQADQQRRRFLYDRYWQQLNSRQKMKDIPPTDAEVREYFDQNRASFPPRSEAVSFKQIVITPTASDSAKKVALTLIDSILVELRKGADFGTAARRFSMDPATREQGGSLNWIRRGQGYDPKFEAAAFLLRPGQISEPVETSFGYHLIQVERAQPAEVQVRHILIMPVVDSIRADSTRLLAESVYRAVKDGAPFDSLQRLHHDKMEEREAEQFPLDRLVQSAPSYGEAIRDVKEGELVPLFRLDSPDPNRSKWAIVQLTKRIPAGDVRFEDVRDQIRARLAGILGREKHLTRLREANFVEVRPI
ncbi:MAG: peptidylprolyl isomerase [Gemmatimonadales bacterium]|nr:peptidylprolyl isomerase [Gemmatimonadales bacterium]